MPKRRLPTVGRPTVWAAGCPHSQAATRCHSAESLQRAKVSILPLRSIVVGVCGRTDSMVEPISPSDLTLGPRQHFLWSRTARFVVWDMHMEVCGNGKTRIYWPAAVQLWVSNACRGGIASPGITQPPHAAPAAGTFSPMRDDPCLACVHAHWISLTEPMLSYKIQRHEDKTTALCHMSHHRRSLSFAC
jgi:hypothetical protein